MILLSKLDPADSVLVTFKVPPDVAEWLAEISGEMGCSRPTLCRYLVHMAREHGGLGRETTVEFRNRFTSHMDPKAANKPRVSSAFVLLEEDYKQVVEYAYLLDISYSKFVRDSIENHMNSWRVRSDVDKARSAGRHCPPDILESRRKKRHPNGGAGCASSTS
jgi:hypothetical protein